jgi:phosphoribosyl-dephospho-CoA transferase
MSLPLTMPLQRHRLAYLSQAGWATVRALAWDAQAQACIDHWADHRLPLVVTRQSSADARHPLVALGLPAPLQWARRRLCLKVSADALSWLDEFPVAAEAADADKAAGVHWHRPSP